ncbi:MAG: hypothetical protein FD133_1499 [Erysipelotrichaceae bacterium]|nr:MAG: hypothetical protein FD179_1736 [Erysipelotrichaceae bacterium]TXT17206.1 MAG: hypothetical protein FD133_1499 [Erysipelotrichaceae bacterium]
MEIIELIQNAIVQQFTGTISLSSILLSLVSSFVIALFILVVYKRTYNGVVMSRSFSLLLVLLAMVTSLAVRTISSNLALSLGMVGALSIVRYRTAVKDPMDTGFIFWAIMAGIMTGIGLYLIAIVSALALGLLFMLVFGFQIKKSAQFLLIVRYESTAHEAVMTALSKLPAHKLRNKTMVGSSIELTYDIEIKAHQEQIVDPIKAIRGVDSVNLISYQNDYGL